MIQRIEFLTAEKHGVEMAFSQESQMVVMSVTDDSGSHLVRVIKWSELSDVFRAALCSWPLRTEKGEACVKEGEA